MQIGDNIGIGNLAISETVRISLRTDASTALAEGLRVGESFGRVRLWDDRLEFGPGTGTLDTSLTRTAAGVLTTGKVRMTELEVLAGEGLRIYGGPDRTSTPTLGGHTPNDTRYIQIDDSNGATDGALLIGTRDAGGNFSEGLYIDASSCEWKGNAWLTDAPSNSTPYIRINESWAPLGDYQAENFDDRYLQLTGGTLTGTLSITNNDPRLTLYESDASPDNKRADWIHQGGSFIGRLYNDAGSVAGDWLTLTRNGAAPVALTFRPARAVLETSAPTLILAETGQTGDTWGLTCDNETLAVARFDRSTQAWKSTVLFFPVSGSMTYNGATVWTSANDGDGSALDAGLWQGRTIRGSMSASGTALEFGGIYWDGTKWAHQNSIAGRFGWALRHGDASDAAAGAGGDFQIVFGTTGSTGAGSTAEPTKLFRVDKAGRVQFDRFISTVATGTAPFSSTSTTVCPNLNASLLQGYGPADFALASHSHTFAAITSKPTTVSGFGITDAWTKTESDARFEFAFSKGSLIQGSGVTLTGTLTGRLVGSGDVTVSASAASLTLDALTDVTITTPVNLQFLKYNGSQWVNSAHGLTYTDVGAAASSHNHDGYHAKLSGSAQTISASTTFSGGLSMSGGTDISSSGDYRGLVRDSSTNSLRTMTASYMRGWLDAAATVHTHAISDVVGLQTALDAKVPTSRNISTGTGLTGGGNLTVDRTLSIASTGVSAGSYGAASGQSVPYFTVNAQGQITSASSRNITAADLGAAATLVFVTTTEVTLSGSSLTDGVYRTVLGSIRSPLSTTLSASALASGYVLRIEAFGSFRGNDQYAPQFRVKIGSSYTVLFSIDEPNSMSMLEAGAWNCVVNLLVVTSGSSATVVTRGHWDVGAPNSGASDYVIRTKPTISGTLNTTVSNAIAVDFAGNANVTAFSCSSVIASII
jgi:hypothetical protein